MPEVGQLVKLISTLGNARGIAIIVSQISKKFVGSSIPHRVSFMYFVWEFIGGKRYPVFVLITTLTELLKISHKYVGINNTKRPQPLSDVVVANESESVVERLFVKFVNVKAWNKYLTG